jgi:PAS domain S-box-containing protein
MNFILEPKKFRILVADDEYAYLDLFEEVLASDGPMSFELVTCGRAVEAVQSVKKSIEQNHPFAVAFLDIRMPSGPDGLWAAKQIRDMDPHIEIVIITAYSDYAPIEIISNVPPAHKLIYMQKPFCLREIHHFAYALSSKWQNELNWLKINDKMEAVVEARTKALSNANEQLKREVFKHKQTAELLKVSEEKHRQLFINESDAVMIFDAETNRFEDANPAALTLFGYSKEQFLNLDVEDVSAEKDTTKIAMQSIKSSNPFSKYVSQCQFKKKDNTVFPGEIYAGIYFSNGRGKVIGAVRDITDRLRAEEGLHILSANLLSAQEKERKQIAMELHDDFGQILNVLKLNLRHIFNKLTNDQENLKNECEKSIRYVKQVLEKVRRLSHGLTPTTLDDLGLSTALNALIRDFARHSKIKISCDFDDIDNLFSSMDQLIIYRVFQEALMNIQNHSKADHVVLIAKNDSDNISFIIEDNGKGFDVKQLYSKALHEYGLGLASMRERVRMLNGHLDISSRLSQGTKIVFNIPFMKGEKKSESLPGSAGR